MAGVYDFDEDDIQPFPRKPPSKSPLHVSRSIKNAEQITAHRKHQRKTVSEKRNTVKNDEKQSGSKSLPSVRKPSKCKLSNGITMTQSFGSSSRSENMEELVRIKGCYLEVSSASPQAEDERLSEVMVAGKGLWCNEEMIQMHSVEFAFMTDSITLKLLDDQNVTTVVWPLHEINGFDFRICNQTNDNILELNLTASGMMLLEQKFESLFFRSDFVHGKGNTLTTKIKSAYQSDHARKITSLCDCYKRLWKCGQINRHKEMSIKRDLQEPNNVDLPKCTEWFDLTYPKGDPDAVLVTMDDFLLLNPHEFVSDTIIDFYIKYLQSRLTEREKKQCYFFNSFFFRKLACLDVDPACELEKTSALFEQVKRWTREINIFTKDFLFIPIVQSCHWSLVIVCYPNHLFDDEHRKRYIGTTLLHFDSMEGFHKGVEEKIEKYLVQHWSHMSSTDRARNDKSCSVKCIRAKVPQQTNYSDCGLFVLHYVEMFLLALQSGLSEIPVSRDWFNPEDVASKRGMLQRLIKGIQEEERDGNSARKHVDKHLHDSDDLIEDVLESPQKKKPEELCFETDELRRSPRADCFCHLQPVDSASYKAVCRNVAQTAGNNQLRKVVDTRHSDAPIKIFDIEPSNSPIMENNPPSCQSKDKRQSIDDTHGQREESNKTQESRQVQGFATSADVVKNREADEMQISWHTLEASSEEDLDEGPFNLDVHSKKHGNRLCRLPFKEQQALLQADEKGLSCDSDIRDDITCTGPSSRATPLKGNLVGKTACSQYKEQGHSSTENLHQAQTSESRQVYISSDEDSGFVKVQKMVDASRLRQQRRAGCSKVVSAPSSASKTSKGIKKQPQSNAKWRLRRLSQFHFH